MKEGDDDEFYYLVTLSITISIVLPIVIESWL
jgi:hypothetical protein